MTPSYDALTAAHAHIHRLNHLLQLAYWDRAAVMPPQGAQARAEAMAAFSGLLHRLRTAPELGQGLASAAQEPLNDLQRANLREMQRDWQHHTALPEHLVERRSLVTAACEQAWRQQRPANDWAGYLPNLKAVIEVAREEALLLSDRQGLSPYDALLDQYEPGMRSAEVARVFGEVRQWLPGLIQQVAAHQATEPVVQPQGPFPVAAQRRVCDGILRVLGFDFEAGRLDVSTHPFSGGVPEDVRLTTRFREDDFIDSLMSTIHETGHGRYEQNLPREWLGQPVALARSMAIHESQSLAFEMQIGRHPGFARVLAPLLQDAFGPQAAFEPENLHRVLTRVRPSLIRVEADEVTYPAHIILRFEIEQALIAGDAEAEDIPALWDAGMQRLLGLDTRGNFRDGPMQDVHWTEGLFGYFPCYSLGAMYAAQWFATIRRQMPGVDRSIAQGQLDDVFDWLRDHIWLQASRWPTDELTRRASGEALNPAHFRRHLETRYLG